MHFDDFQKLVWQQKDTGPEGFEGLIAKLLEYFTGQRFYLSGSGRQKGRDISSNYLWLSVNGIKTNLLQVENC